MAGAGGATVAVATDFFSDLASRHCTEPAPEFKVFRRQPMYGP